MDIAIQLAMDFHGKRPPLDQTPDVPIDSAFPEKFANELATRESFNKHLYRPNTYLHKWWARRSGTTFRHILKQLVDDSARRDFYEAGGLEGKIILDPMMGGATTLHEAIRMGANVFGMDIDPIPVLQAKATLTLPPLSHKKKVFQEYLGTLRKRLAPFYRTTCPTCRGEAESQFVLYGLRRRCQCQDVLFVDSLLLRQGNHQDIYLCATCKGVTIGNSHRCSTRSEMSLVVKGTQRCKECRAPYVDILNEPFVDRYIPLVVVGGCRKHGQFYKTVDEGDLELLMEARAKTEKLHFGDVSQFAVPTGPKSDDLIRRGIGDFRDLFTPRQLLYLEVSASLLSELPDADRLWLGLLVSTSLEFNSLLCGYKGSDLRRPGAIRHVFSHHAYSFPYTALENNPIFSGNTSGTLNRLFFDRVLKAGEWATAPIEVRVEEERQRKVEIRGEVDGGQEVSRWQDLFDGNRRFMVVQGDAGALDVPEAAVDYVVTDPPYYDSVQYSDLSNFFRVWLRAFLPKEADWGYDQFASAVAEGGALSGSKYGELLTRIWKTCFRVLKKERGRLIFTFHHWNPDAWAELTLSLKRAGFALVNRYVVFSENPVSVHIKGLKALKHDTILVLKPKLALEKQQDISWPEPSRIDTTESDAFCRDCGTALGWFLATGCGEPGIRNGWRNLIQGGGNGKTAQ